MIFQVRLLQSLYEASLYKIEKVYNHLRNSPEPHYEHAQRFAKSYNDKVCFGPKEFFLSMDQL